MKKDFLLTFLTEFLVLASALLIYKLVAQVFGKDDFSEYALIRRTLSFILPAMLLGLGIGIPRYMAFSLKSANPESSDSFFRAGLIILLPFTLSFGVVLLLFKRFFAYLFFGNSAYAPFMAPMCLMLLGMVLSAAAYSYYRGRLRMGKANLLQMLNMAIVPVLALLLAKNLLQLFTMTGAAWTAVSAFFIITIIKNSAPPQDDLPARIKTLLAYGLQRVPGDFGLAALLALPATFTAHLSGIQKAGSVAFGISLLNMAGSVFAPIGLILLPKASQLIASKNLDVLISYVRRVLAITFGLTAAGVLVFELFAGRIIELYLGRSYSDLLVVTRIIMAGSLAYTVYVSLRSIIDAYHFKAINTLNILISLSLFVVFSLVVILRKENDLLIVIAFVLALGILGLLTLKVTRKILKNKDAFAETP